MGPGFQNRGLFVCAERPPPSWQPWPLRLWLAWEISGKAGMQPASQKSFALSIERSVALAAGCQRQKALLTQRPPACRPGGCR